MLKPYLSLMKPGIIWGNIISGLGGFFYATGGVIIIDGLVGVVLGLICIIGSACGFNNILDRDIDAIMLRTQDRVLVTNAISVRSAFIFSSILGTIGFLVLWFLTSLSAFAIGLFGFFAYVVLYTILTKRSSVYGTLIGSLSGAVPPVLGYVAIVDSFNIQALFLWAMYIIWQMPHSYGIALFRLDDYKLAKISVLPVVKGIQATYVSIVAHITIFTILISIFGYMGYLHPISLFFTLCISMYWSFIAIFLFKTEPIEKWAKKVFITSLFVVVVLTLSLAFSGVFARL